MCLTWYFLHIMVRFLILQPQIASTICHAVDDWHCKDLLTCSHCMVGDRDRKLPLSRLFGFCGACPCLTVPPGMGSCLLAILSAGLLLAALPCSCMLWSLRCASSLLPAPCCCCLLWSSGRMGCMTMPSEALGTSWGPRAKTGLMPPAEDSMKDAERRVICRFQSGSESWCSGELADAERAATLHMHWDPLIFGCLSCGMSCNARDI